ncbi:hypothetical protein KAH94_03420 [bacterium]|nr:hypothetical protein [bacterium]
MLIIKKITHFFLGLLFIISVPVFASQILKKFQKIGYNDCTYNCGNGWYKTDKDVLSVSFGQKQSVETGQYQLNENQSNSFLSIVYSFITVVLVVGIGYGVNYLWEKNTIAYPMQKKCEEYEDDENSSDKEKKMMKDHLKLIGRLEKQGKEFSKSINTDSKDIKNLLFAYKKNPLKIKKEEKEILKKYVDQASLNKFEAHYQIVEKSAQNIEKFL